MNLLMIYKPFKLLIGFKPLLTFINLHTDSYLSVRLQCLIGKGDGQKKTHLYHQKASQ